MEVSVTNLLRRALLNWWRLALCAFGGAVALFALSFAFESSFVSKTVLVYEQNPSRGSGADGAGILGGVAALAGLSVGSSADRSTAVATLESRTLLVELIESGNLLPILFADMWNAQQKAWTVPADEVPTEADGFRLLSKKVFRVKDDPATGLIEIRSTWRDPTQAKLWLVTLVSKANQRLQQQTISEAEANIAYLKDRLAETHVVEMRNAIASLTAAQMKSLMLARSRSEFVFRTVDAAYLPDRPDGPNRVLMALLGVVAGVILYVAFEFVWMIRKNMGEGLG